MRQKHPWGRFKPGAWKQVRVETQTLDEKGQVTGSTTTETLTILEDVSEHDFTLRIEVTVDAAGKRFSSQPQMVKQGFHGELDGQKIQARKVGDGNITINGRAIPCETREVVVNGGETRRVSTVQLADRVFPFVLKRDTVGTDAEGKVTNYQTTMEVVVLDVPVKVLTDLKNASFIKTIHKQPKGSSVTLEVHCDDVPGGVVSHTTREDDERGRTTRRSTLELIDYGTSQTIDEPNQPPRRRLINRAGRPRTSSAADAAATPRTKN